MKRRMCVLALLLCLVLTACGGKEPDSRSRDSLSEESAEISETEPLLTVDGREVPAWRYLCWLEVACCHMQEQYAAAGMEPDWTAPMEQGTLADYVKNQALADTALYATVENWAEQYGCVLTAAEKAELKKESGVILVADLSAELTAELAGVGVMYGKLYALSQTEGSALAPTRRDLEGYREAAGWLGVNRILVAAGDDRDAARNRAAEIFSQLNAAENQAETFAVLAADQDDPAGNRTFRQGDGTLEETLERAALALEEGQCSGILESEEGFSILRREPVEEAVMRESWFDWHLQQAAANAVVQTAADYERLDVPSIAQQTVEKRNRFQ